MVPEEEEEPENAEVIFMEIISISYVQILSESSINKQVRGWEFIYKLFSTSQNWPKILFFLPTKCVHAQGKTS